MQDLTDSIISPMLESARQITDSSHVRYAPPEFPVADDELAAWEKVASDAIEMYASRMSATNELFFSASDLKRLLATVRALQRDLAEARAKLVEAGQLIGGKG